LFGPWAYVLPLFEKCEFAISNFDLWMSKDGYEFFEIWLEAKNITFGLFKSLDTVKHALEKKLIDLLHEYGLENKIIKFVKGDGSNLNTTTNALRFIVKFESLI